MNHFTGDHPYCVCEVQHFDKSAQAAKVETQPVLLGDTLNPVWDEAWEIEPWYQGEALEFTVYDKGLIGSKTEGKVLLPSEMFFPNGFSGMLNISGLQHATLQVEVQVVATLGGAEYPTPVPTVMNYGAPCSHFEAFQSYNIPQAPQMIYAAPPMIAYTATPQPMAVMAQQPVTYAAPPVPSMAPTYTLPQTTGLPMSTASQQLAVVPMPAEAQPPTATNMIGGPQKLAVSILQAHGLKHMNHFTGDHPYVTCQVKSVDGSSHAKVETKPVTEGDTTNPFWGETHTVDPWHLGDNLEFTVYDKGLVGSKTEGKVVLPAGLFYPGGFSGMLQISGLPQALLHVIVRPMGPSNKEEAVLDGEQQAETSPKKKKKKKLKTKKCHKACC